MSNDINHEAYASTSIQSEIFQAEAKILMGLAADKLTMSSYPGNPHHEIVLDTPRGRARLTVDYAHGDCDIDEEDLDVLITRILDNKGHDHVLNLLAEFVAAVYADLSFQVQEDMEADYGDYDDDPDVDWDGPVADWDYDFTPEQQAWIDHQAPSQSVVPTGDDAVRTVIQFINLALVNGGDAPLTADEEAYLIGQTRALAGL